MDEGLNYTNRKTIGASLMGQGSQLQVQTSIAIFFSIGTETQCRYWLFIFKLCNSDRFSN